MVVVADILPLLISHLKGSVPSAAPVEVEYLLPLGSSRLPETII